jgi:hypothetical protein
MFTIEFGKDLTDPLRVTFSLGNPLELIGDPLRPRLIGLACRTSVLATA